MDKPMAIRNEDLEKNESLTYPDKLMAWLDNAAWTLMFLGMFYMCIVLISDY